MIFSPRSSRSGPGRFDHWKLAVFWIGAALLLAGMATDRRPLVAAALGVLALGFLLRFFDRPPPPEYSEDDEDLADGDPVDDDPAEGGRTSEGAA